MTKSNESAPWWHGTTVYQIYPRSFLDKNADGIGDLAGILEKLDYLCELGVETLWLSPFFKSPQRDFGYDISDHYAIAPEYGTLDDVKRLIDAAHARGLRLVLDMVLNHTSDEHPWFLESRQSRDNPRRDFYIWRKGRKPRGAAPPNNWKSLIGPSGWHYDKQTEEWYFASFLPFQPDLNYRNPAVQEAMLNVVRHWLGLGFDGMRLDIFNCLFKDQSFANNPFSFRPIPTEDNPDGFFQSYVYTVNHSDTLDFARTLRKAVDEFSSPERFLVGEVFGAPSMLRRYCIRTKETDGLHLVFLFKSLRTPFSAPAFRSLIAEFEQEFPAPLLPTYVFGNHDRARCSERLSHDQAKEKLLVTLQLTVRGVPFVYYGEEIGMRNLDLPMSRALDPMAKNFRFLPTPAAHFLRKRGMLVNRDECRGPMQWNAAPHAGFTAPEATPWLPVHPLFPKENLVANQANPDSLFHCYKRLLALRKNTPALHRGALELSADAQDPVLGYRRILDGEALEVRLNFSAEPQPLNLSAKELMFSTHLDARQNESRTSKKNLTLLPYEGIVARTS